jgi:hypothetical protein
MIKCEGKTDEMVANSAASEESKIEPVSVQVEVKEKKKKSRTTLFNIRILEGMRHLQA